MANYTENYGLVEYESGDTFALTGLNSNFSTLDDVLGGFRFVKCTAEEYEAAQKNESTFYAVTSADGVKLYLGEYEISGGGSVSAGAAALASRGAVGTAGAAEREDL